MISKDIFAAFLFVIVLQSSKMLAQGQTTPPTSPPAPSQAIPSSLSNQSSVSSMPSLSINFSEELEVVPLNSNTTIHDDSRRKLYTSSDFARIGDGQCPGTFRKVYHATNNLSPNRCLEAAFCGSNVKAYSHAIYTRRCCKSCCEWHCWGSAKHGDCHWTNCLCHSVSNPLTRVHSPTDQGWKCYTVIKGNQLQGTDYDDDYLHLGEGACTGRTNSEVGTLDKGEKYTDNACAAACYSHMGFSRDFSSRICKCYTSANGELKKEDSSGSNCYVRTKNLISGDSGFSFQGSGSYYPTSYNGNYDSAAECAKNCLDTHRTSLKAIHFTRALGNCWCALNGATVQFTSKDFARYEASTQSINCPTNSGLAFFLSDNKLELNTKCKCFDRNGGTAKTLSIYGSDTCDCPATSWCNQDQYHKLYVDCDGDGNKDTICVQGDKYIMKKSQNECNNVEGFNVAADCPAANYGNEEFSTEYFWKGVGPCRGSSNNQQFSHFQTEDKQESDEDCARQCALKQEYREKVVSFSRNPKTKACFCQFQKDTAGFTSRVTNHNGIGGVSEGTDNRWNCYGHYQSGNQIEGRSGFNFIGTGRCLDNAGRRYPYFQPEDPRPHTEAQCAKMCLEEYPSGVLGIQRSRKTFDCYCLVDDTDSGHSKSGGWGGRGHVEDFAEYQDHEYACYGLDKTSRVTDCPLNSVLTTDFDSTGLKTLESWCDCDSTLGKDVYEVGETCNCTRPYEWCTDPGDHYVHTDCDNDGTLDSICITPGYCGSELCETSIDYRLLKSSNECNEIKGNDASGGNVVCPKSLGCSAAAADWCGSGWSFHSIDCDGDGVKDVLCRQGNNYKIRKSTDGCIEAAGSNLGAVCPAANSCTRPNIDWCTDAGNRYFLIDCDGDGGLDSVCKTDTGYILIKSSASGGCTESRGSNLAQACPASGCIRPEIFCGHIGSQFYYVDCDGDGKLDSHCRDNEGATWTLASNNNCISTRRDKCSAADFCTHREEWCDQSGSHYFSVDPRGEDPDADTSCTNDIGFKWLDTNCQRPLEDQREDRSYIVNGRTRLLEKEAQDLSEIAF